MKNANKIHKEYISGFTPFRDWLTVEKVHYGMLKSDNIEVDMDFDNWLDEKYALNGKEAWFNETGDDVNDYNKGMLNKAQTGDKTWYTKAIEAGWLGLNIYDKFKDVAIGAEQEQEELVKADSNDNDKNEAKNYIFGINKYLVYGLSALVIGGTLIWAYKKFNTEK